MKTQQELDYERIAEAITFLKNNFKAHPKLDEAAEHVHLSPFHFHRMFQELSLIHISEPTRQAALSRMPSAA